MNVFKIEYDNIITNKDDLINQLESLKEEAIYMLKNPYHDEIFQKDLHALKIVIDLLKCILNEGYGQNIKEVEQ